MRNIFVCYPAICFCLQFVADACRYVASDLATDVVVHVREVKFYLHKVGAQHFLLLHWCRTVSFF
jgi:hypothetical protein